MAARLLLLQSHGQHRCGAVAVTGDPPLVRKRLPSVARSSIYSVCKPAAMGPGSRVYVQMAGGRPHGLTR